MNDIDKSELSDEEISQGFDDMGMPVSAQLVRELSFHIEEHAHVYRKAYSSDDKFCVVCRQPENLAQAKETEGE